MVGKKNVGGFLAVISALVLIVVILLTVIEQNAFDLDFYRSEYTKFNSTEVIGISEQELIQTTQVLFAYIKGERDDLKTEAVIKGQRRQVFNQREIEHMVDVQRLYAFAHGARNAGLVLLLFLLVILRLVQGGRFFKYLAGGYLAGTAVFVILLGVVGLAISQDFLWFWHHFHYLVFTNDLWILNPKTDILIQIVPEGFFLDLVVRILSFFAAAIMILAIASAVFLIESKHK